MPKQNTVLQKIKAFVQMNDLVKTLGIKKGDDQLPDVFPLICPRCQLECLRLKTETEQFSCSFCKQDGGVIELVMFVNECNERDAVMFLHNQLPKDKQLSIYKKD